MTSEVILRLSLLFSVMISLALIFDSVFRYPRILPMPGGYGFVIEPVVMLALYGFAIVWLTGRRKWSLRVGTIFGLIGAALQITHMVVENTVVLSAALDRNLTFFFMLSTFAWWLLAGCSARRSMHRFSAAALAGFWSAVVTMSCAVLFGLVFELHVFFPAPSLVATWQEFQRSGWSDVHAFTIANTLESAFSHLLIGPIVGVVMGIIGGAVIPWHNNEVHFRLVPFLRGSLGRARRREPHS